MLVHTRHTPHAHTHSHTHTHTPTHTHTHTHTHTVHTNTHAHTVKVKGFWLPQSTRFHFQKFMVCCRACVYLAHTQQALHKHSLLASTHTGTHTRAYCVILSWTPKEHTYRCTRRHTHTHTHSLHPHTRTVRNFTLDTENGNAPMSYPFNDDVAGVVSSIVYSVCCVIACCCCYCCCCCCCCCCLL